MISSIIVIAATKGPPPPVWFPFFFVGVWLTVCFVLSRMGWCRFASTYPCDSQPKGERYSVPYAVFGTLTRYNNVVSVIPNDAGIYFSAFFLFRAFHSPFLLPWSSVRKIETLNGFFSRGYTLHIQDPVGSFQMTVRSSFGPVLERFAPQLLPVQ